MEKTTRTEKTTERFAFRRQADPSARYQWMNLCLVSEGKVTTLELTPALLAGWKVDRVRESSPDDWPGMDAARIATWIRHNWTDTAEIDPREWDSVMRSYQRRMEAANA